MPQEWDRVMSINLRGHFIAMQHELPLMLSTSTRPAIVLTSSVCGHMAHPGMSAYTASKFAIRGLAQAAATEYGPRGLRVNTVSPGEGLSRGFEQCSHHRMSAVLGCYIELA